jgi:hypothetical protein
MGMNGVIRNLLLIKGIADKLMMLGCDGDSSQPTDALCLDNGRYLS